MNKTRYILDDVHPDYIKILQNLFKKQVEVLQNNPDAFEKFDEKMLEYCIQDVKLTKKLYEKFMSKGFSKESIELEHKVSFITKEQELRGFYFDEKKAQSLQAKLLSKYNDLKLQLEKTFIDWEEDLGEFIPKVNSKKFGYKKGVPINKTKSLNEPVHSFA